jgi:hypothetical protein
MTWDAERWAIGVVPIRTDRGDRRMGDMFGCRALHVPGSRDLLTAARSDDSGLFRQCVLVRFGTSTRLVLAERLYE